MRLFVAVDIDDDTRAQLVAARRSIESVIAQARVPPRVTWVNPELAHVTLRFIGETPETHLAAIQDALGSLAIDPFDVVWDAVGAFGGVHRPRVLWVAPATAVEPFRRLATRVSAILDPLIGPGEAREFKPHITLGRVRDAGRGADWRAALAAVALTPSVTRVDQVTLYESRLSPKGPTYTAVSRHG